MQALAKMQLLEINRKCFISIDDITNIMYVNYISYNNDRNDVCIQYIVIKSPLEVHFKL
jgi:hypothetical protein